MKALVKNRAIAAKMPREFRGKNVKATIHLRNATKKKNVANRKYT